MQVKGGWSEFIARKSVLSQWEHDRRKSRGDTVEEDIYASEQLAQYSPSMRLSSIDSPITTSSSSAKDGSDKSSQPAETKTQSTSGGTSTGAAPAEAKRDDVIFEVTSSNFQSIVVDSKVPVLIDVYADWCGPCKQLTPILETAAVKAGGAFRLAKVNADTDRSIVDALEVTGFPTVFVWKKGKLIDR